MDAFPFTNNEQMQCRGILHIVEAGDTLYKIGKKYGVSVSRIMYANPYVNVYNLQIGDEICVPVMLPRMPAPENRMQSHGTEMPEATYENHMGFPTEADVQPDADRQPDAYGRQTGGYMGSFMDPAREAKANPEVMRETDGADEEEREQMTDPDHWEGE